MFNKNTLIEMVKAAGQEVIDRAEDLVGQGDFIEDFDIWLRFPNDNTVPSIEVTRSHTSKNCYEVILKERGNY